jgi:hypothetical protein
MTQLPEALLAYWNANTIGLPPLWFEFAPEVAQPPVAIFDPEGFSRDWGNVGFSLDTYRYKFSIYQLDPVTSYTQGFTAVSYMNDFQFPGLVMVTPKPESMATPALVGQANVWAYEFSLDINITPQN